MQGVTVGLENGLRLPREIVFLCVYGSFMYIQISLPFSLNCVYIKQKMLESKKKRNKKMDMYVCLSVCVVPWCGVVLYLEGLGDLGDTPTHQL
jgi:predicted membrane channel-forming protein YqfA (hemolysin III family)